MFKARLRQWGMGIALCLPIACSETPSQKVAAGQDANLFKKSDLLVGPQPINQLDEQTSSLVEGLASKHEVIKFEVSKNYLTILGGPVAGAANTPVRQFEIKGHWDLKPEKNKDGERNQYLVKNNTDNPNWQARAYIEVDPYDPRTIKAARAALVNLFAVESIKPAYKFGVEAIPGITARELEALAKQFDLVTGDIVRVKMTKSEMILFTKSAAGNPVIISRSRVSYYDLVRAENGLGEKTPEMIRDTKAVWSRRKFVEITPEGIEILGGDKQMIDKAGLVGRCYPPHATPIAEVNEILSRRGVTLKDDEALCFDVSQTVLSLYLKGKSKQRELLLTFDVVDHVDVNLGGEDFFDVLTPGTQTRTWDRRKYVRIKTNNPKFAENHVGPFVMSREQFNGEYIYVATVVAAHSENGMFFEGLTFTGDDRLQFDFSEVALTAYKVGETLNQSGSKTPSLRFVANHFDVERVRNSYGDGTHVIGETAHRPWQDRRNVRIDWASNTISGFYNELFAGAAILGEGYLQSASQLASDITAENGFIMFDTEETLTPKAPVGETGTQPVAVTVRHAFMRVDGRSYEPKEYGKEDFARFGYFRTTERGLDEDGQPTDDSLRYYIGRHDIRDGKKIVFYLSPDYPQRYLRPTREVIEAWNLALEAATGRDNVIELRENTGQKVGDPRFNMIWYAKSRALAAPAGYGPSIPDPLTGEFVSSRTLIYDEAIRFYRRAMGDYYDLIKAGKLPSDFEQDQAPAISGLPGENVVAHDPFAGLDDVRAQFVRETPRTRRGWQEIAQQSTGSPIDVTRALEKLSKQGAGDIASVFNSGFMQEFKYASDFQGMIKEAKLIDGYLAGRGQCMYGVHEHIVSAVQFIQANTDLDRDQLIEKIDELSFFSVLIHELGHNLGLRHNFFGSFDEFNFHPEYRALKALEESGQAADGDYSANYRSSSVMDYVDMFEGLAKKPGLYDVAAIKYGYAEKLEVVQRTVDGEIVRDEAGFPIFEDKHTGDITSQDLLRPYKFCTDGHVWNDPTCNRFDRGLTISEITQSHIAQYDYDYFMRGFRRGRRDFTGSSSRVLLNTILPIRQVLDETFFKLLTSQFEGQDPNGQVQPGNFSDYLQALNTGFSFFADLLETVEPGQYSIDPVTKLVSEGFSDKEGALNLFVPLGLGKYLEAAYIPGSSDFGDDSERVLRRGVQFDKTATMWALTLRGFPAEKYQRASLAANYFALAKDTLLGMLSRYMRDAYETNVIAVRDPESGVYVAVDQVPIGAETEAATFKLPANTNLSMKVNAMAFAMLNYNSTADRTFGDYVDFRLKGVDDASLPAGVETVEFTNVSGIKTYVVPQTADGQSISFAVAGNADKLASEHQALRTQLIDLEALLERAVEQGYEQVFLATEEIYEAATGAVLDRDTAERLRTAWDAENLNVMISFITNVEAQATAAGDAELLDFISAQKLTFAASIVGFVDAFARRDEVMAQSEDIARQLTGIESDLILLRELYETLK